MKFKQSFIITAVIINCISHSFGQSADKKDETKEIKTKFSGFFKYDCWFDSRKNAEALDGLFLLYPLNQNKDKLGRDLNGESNVNMIAVTTRLNTTISGPKVFNADPTIFVEGDFSGVSGSIYHVRFRHAIAKLKWQNTEFMAGRYWHPLFVTDVFPSVASLNTGVPFQAFNRSPQIRVTQKFSNFEAIASAVYQADYKSNGPNGGSSEYIKNAKIPNLNFRLQYKSKKSVIGIATDYKVLKPQLFSESLIDSGDVYQNKETVESITFMGYAKMHFNNLTFKAKAMNGQNLYEHLLPGGYAVSEIDSLTGEKSYTPSQNLYLWGNLLYGKDFQVGLMGGYMQNNGFTEDITAEIYSRASDIEYIYRFSPHVSYMKNKMKLALEWERTTAAYGTLDLENKGKVSDSKEVNNNRILFSMMYFF